MVVESTKGCSYPALREAGVTDVGDAENRTGLDVLSRKEAQALDIGWSDREVVR